MKTMNDYWYSEEEREFMEATKELIIGAWYSDENFKTRLDYCCELMGVSLDYVGGVEFFYTTRNAILTENGISKTGKIIESINYK